MQRGVAAKIIRYRIVVVRSEDSTAFSLRRSAADHNGPWSQLGIEEGWRQKARQNIVVLEWGARLNAALVILV